MINIKKIDLLVYLLIIFSISSFFIGFYFDENSAGAGSLNGDFTNVWQNLTTFLNYDLLEALDLIKLGDRNYYASSRPPLLYILNSKFNPFVFSINSFIKSIFFLSLLGFVLFYYLLKIKFHNKQKKLVILISSCLLLSPYYRTSSYWGLEENYGLISVIVSLYFYNNLLFKTNSDSNYLFHKIFFMSFFSSLSVYFDQKLLIVPFLILISFLKSNLNNKEKKYLILFYFIFSIPYIYLISEWKNIVPPGDAGVRSVGTSFFYYHPVYTSTMIAFYLVPLIFFKKNLFNNFKLLITDKFYIKLFFIYFLYLLYLLFFHDFNSEALIGKGIIHKFSNKFIENILLKKLFIYFFSFCSFVLILIFIKKNLIKSLFIIFLFLMSSFTYPLQQEYFDPIILIMFFGILEKKIILNKTNSIFLFCYLALFLITANIYYNLIL